MNAFIRLRFLFSLLTVGVSFMAFAQSNVIARQGPFGIYLFLGKNIPSGKMVSSYKIERKQGSGDWKQIAEVKCPSAFAVFKARVEAAKSQLPSQPVVSGAKLQQLYETAVRTGTSDSLKAWMLQYPVKIGLGLLYHDSTAKTGIGFKYRISSMTSQGTVLETKESDSLSMPYSAVFDEVQLAESSRSAKEVFLKWRSAGKNPPPLFMVQRMDNHKPVPAVGLTGRYSVNDTTYFTFRDTVTPTQESGELQYFLVPYDHLGNMGKYSQVVALTTDNFNKAYFMSARVRENPGEFGNRISWQFSDQGTVLKMELLRSEREDLGFALIATLNRTDTLYIDDRITPGKTYYYQLRAVSRSGKRYQTSEIIHYTPSESSLKIATPEILSATGVPGGVKLIIRQLDGKSEGYRVFRKGGRNRDFAAISQLIPKSGQQEVFVDSASGLSGRILYTYVVRAERSGYGISDLSDARSAKPMLNSDPLSPGYIKAFADNKKTILFWEDVRQADSTIIGYRISRREEIMVSKPMKDFQVIAGETTPGISNTLLDSTAAPGKIYTYAIQSVGEDGLLSSKGVMITVSSSGDIPFAPAKCTMTRKLEQVSMQWTPVNYPGLKEFRINLLNPDNSLLVLHTLSPQTNAYSFQVSNPGGNEKYCITTVNEKGKESEPAMVDPINE